jgi:hypothetical protein
VCGIFERGMGGGGSLWPTSLFFSVPFSLFFSEIEVLMDGHPDRQVRSDMLGVPFATPVGGGGGGGGGRKVGFSFLGGGWPIRV